MNKSEKVLLVILIGSIMGAVELFGGDLFRGLGIPSKSSYLFALGIMLMLASKRLIDFRGSVVIMAAIASIFKTASANYYSCQVSAIMINAFIFEIAYFFLKGKLESSLIRRSISAPIIAYISYAAFAFAAVYVLKEPHWAAAGMAAIGDYLGLSALIAAGVSIITINLGLYLGDWFKRVIPSEKPGFAITYFRVTSMAIVVIIWTAGLGF